MMAVAVPNDQIFSMEKNGCETTQLGTQPILDLSFQLTGDR